MGGSETDDAIARKLLAAVKLHGAGRQAEAERLYQEIVVDQPANADAWHLLGIVAYQRRDFAVAVERIRKAITLSDANTAYFSNLGLALQGQGDVAGAISSYRRAVALDAGNADALYNLGNALLQAGDLDEAVGAYRRAVEANPQFVEAHNNLGNLLRRLGRPQEAVDSYRRVLALQPQMAETHNNLGNALKALHRFDEAVASYRQAIALQPNLADAHSNLGNALELLNRADEALAAYERALAIRPDFADALNNLGSALYRRDRLADAESALRRAVALEPAHVKAHLNLALVLQSQARPADAAAAYHRVLERSPDHADARLRLFNLHLQICDWATLETDAAAIKRLIADDKMAAADPYLLTFVPGVSAAEQKRAAVAYARHRFVSIDTVVPVPRNSRDPDRKLRIGYLSADFRAHATAYLMADLIELHDRAKFDVVAYSLGIDDGSPIHHRLRGGFDAFHDLRGIADAAAAERIAGDGIDILVDLKGYTDGARPEILARRPAPIQVSYLGYPGTMGAPFIEYLVADRFVCPATAAADYSEVLACLPDTYQPNDRKRPIGPPRARRDFGLPEAGFVFCGFNSVNKITPAVFEIWTSLLRETPDSVLWLLSGDRMAELNLRRMAGERGVGPERLVFAAKLPLSEHLARYAIADLFLDTLPCSGHTTVSDALWSGVPVLTCAGDTFAARVGGSLVRAAGLPELITETLADYARMAQHLAVDRGELQGFRERLARSRLSCLLFDTPRTTRHLEAIYRRMWHLFISGREPEPIDLVPITPT